MATTDAGAGLPRWAANGVLPLVNLVAAFVVSGIVIMILGESPVEAMLALVRGAFGFSEAWGYTLYYATNFIFAALAFSIAMHCGLFNIGGEGQGYIGGLGVGLVCLYLDALPFALLVPVAIVVGALFGAAWGWVPAYLQARRGSHVVITTIMFNFIAATLMVYLLVNVLIEPGQMSPQSRDFAAHARLPADARDDGLAGDRFSAHAAQRCLSLGAGVLGAGVGVRLAYALGIRAAHRRRQSGGRRVRRHLTGAQHHPRHGDLRSAGRHDGTE